VTRSATYLGAKDFQPLANDFDIELGYLYQSPAILAEENLDRGHEDPRQSFGRPGSRAPHLWLERHGQRVSTIDLFGRSFVLLTGPGGTAWTKAAPDATNTSNGLLLATHVVGDLSDPEHRFGAAYGITDSGATLVRPDGFVAWRAKEMVSDPQSELTRVLGAVLRG
jgi:putative polyketide hydroxylase